MELNGTTLVVSNGVDKNLTLASRNIPTVTLATSDSLNTYDVLRPDKLLFTRSAFEKVIRPFDPGIIMNAFEIIKTVRLTEKGTRQGEKYNQYTIVADRLANKTANPQRRAGIVQGQGHQGQYAERARQIPPPAHRPGRPRADWKKAIVTLKEGDKIVLT